MKFISKSRLGSIFAAALCTLSNAQALPIVDLGYAVHQATLNASDSGYFNFTNIRYGKNPVGSLRFYPPIAPTGRNTTVNNGGQTSIMCPQAGPAWISESREFIADLLPGQNISEYTHPSMMPEMSTNNLTALLKPSPGLSEDCLFLDVIVPEKVFNITKTNGTSGYHEAQCEPGQPCKVPSGAPVLVWIHGGGYTTGSKSSSGNPSSLIATSLENDDEGIVYVAINYRLGMFGWLSGSENITSNAGLLDQRLALNWVQQNIYLFGGDPSRVTVIGESAGGGSIMHHITSYGGLGSLPFQKAIPQSPAFQIIVPSQSEQIFANALKNASAVTNMTINTADELRALPFEALYAVNTIMTGLSMYGSFTFGPAVDLTPNSYVPDLPIRLLANGSFHNVSVMAGHNTNEGLLFTPPFVQTQDDFNFAVRSLFPTANETIVDTLTTELYPPNFNGSLGYKTPVERTALMLSNSVVTCNVKALATSLAGYAYVFGVPPGLHGQDIAYTFFNGDTSTLNQGAVVNATVATTFQRYITSFAMTGSPTAEGVLDMIPYGDAYTISAISSKGLFQPALGMRLPDPGAVEACDFWEEAPYYTID
ncbi:related to triacylglycerol lipase I precursor [Rhynchosporium agropyri]|uniref:Carboxylic ester hydrolase n=1 Tax=Rhynchosporium agropyri TaxID=914238 RepID=A0A1E1JW20_9HELO|nr:related to triacylglycerol lipase I precursor [Rhynchosporium agropyri]